MKQFHYILLLCVALVFASKGYAQWYDPEKVAKKPMDIYLKAIEAADEEKYDVALQKMKDALALDARFVDAWLSSAGIKANQKNYTGSVADFEKAIQLDSVYCQNYFLPFSISLAGTGQFNRALQVIQIFLNIPTLNKQSIRAGNYRKSVYEFAVNYEINHPTGNYVFSPQNMGDSINSIHPEYYPALTIDGKTLIFTRRVVNDEDFYESSKTATGWSAAKPLGGKVNTNLNEGAQNISQDGRWIVFTGCNYPEGEGSCDLYIAYKTNQGWSEAQNLGAIVNTDFWESSPSLSPDKQDLYFSSNLAGGFGGKDIWVTHRNAKGQWSRPENLGSTVNTSSDESCAFMYADNQTLFFNSNGHPGYGGTDLFYTKKQTDNSWSTPCNMGYPVNTIDEEGSLIVAADGKTGFYASDKSDTKGALDLYSFELRPDTRPPQTLWVQGKVYDQKTKLGLPSQVELANTKTGQVLSKVQTDEDGNYLTTLPIGQEYAFIINRKGYLFFSEHYNLISPNTDTIFTADIPLKPIEAGASIILKNIFFDTKQTVLKPESKVELDKVIQLMTDNPTIKILITGHTDNVGKVQDNLILSDGRAKAVVAYLLASRLISKDRLQAKGLGSGKPIADNKTEAGKANNRRTELSILSIQ
ncbi:MAG: OmpA family protein [Ferruginibacter sp.]